MSCSDSRLIVFIPLQNSFACELLRHSSSYEINMQQRCYRVIVSLLLVATLLISSSYAHTFTVEDPLSSHQSSHKCIHDELQQSETHVAGGVHDQLRVAATYEPEIWEMIKEQKMYDSKRSLREVHADTFSTIRMKFRLDNIEKDTEGSSQRTCYNKGDKFKRGTPSSTSVICSDTITANCWGTCTDELVVTDAMIASAKSLIPQVQQAFIQMLATRKLTGKISLPNGFTTCGAEGGVPIPSDLQGGIDGSTVDTIMFVTLRPTVTNVLGWATTCLTELAYSRPIMGHLNLSPLIFAESKALQLGVAIHETTHALGFSSNRFDSFIDQSGNKRKNVVVPVSTSFTDSNKKVNTKTIQMITTPEVLNQAKQHFDCNTTTGVPLEELGGSGTAGSHWEKRSFMNELMVGSVGWFNPSESFAISQFTLALLQDSGWYQSNFSYATPLLWGNKMGCSFVSGRCEDWDVTNVAGYYCDQATFSGTNDKISQCTFNLKGKGFCDIRTYKTNLGYYEHMSNPAQGGPDELMDWCPIVYRYSNGRCTDSSNTPLTGERYGDSSGCFDSNANFVGTVRPDKDARCFQYRCVNKQLEIIIAAQTGDKSITCPKDQSYIVITDGLPTGFTGYVACPKNGYKILCEQQKPAAGTTEDLPDTPGGTGNPLCDWFKIWCNSAIRTSTNWYLLFAVVVLSLSLIF
jgi:hypothetical protein